MKKGIRSFAILLLTTSGALSAAIAVPDVGTDSSPPRLRLSDPTQELRTTSVNWPDLVKSAGEKPLPRPRRPIRVVVDAGHGGKDLGAAGGGLVEKALTLRISELVTRSLDRYQRRNDFPLEIRMSRDADVFLPLRERARFANDWAADLFVSIHANSSEFVRARGFEVYFLDQNAADSPAAARLAAAEGGVALNPGVLSMLSDAQTALHVDESSRFAETVFQSMSLSLRPNGRGVHQAPFTVLSGTQMPSLLIEVGYLTNPDDARKLNKGTYLKRIANAISAGIVEFAMHLRGTRGT
jgi:N-acetylmuramoyl-L-alanine amidase